MAPLRARRRGRLDRRAGEGDSTGLATGKVANLTVRVVSELDAFAGYFFIFYARIHQAREVVDVLFYREFFVYRQGLAGVSDVLSQLRASCRLP